MFKKYSQMKLQMKREALAKLNRQANEKECAPSQYRMTGMHSPQDARAAEHVRIAIESLKLVLHLLDSSAVN